MGSKDSCCTNKSKENLVKILEQPLAIPSPKLVATMVHFTFPPGDVGADPHFHPGPVTGYVLEGEFLFQVRGGPIRIFKAGEAFYEEDGDVHVWSANGSDTMTTKLVATIWGKPGQPLLTYLENYEKESREEAVEIARRKN